MEQIWRNTSEFQLLFNCSFYNVSDVPLSKRANFPLGIFVMFITISETVNLIKKRLTNVFIPIIKMLYLPCLVSIWRHLMESCYKLMFTMGILDVLVLLTYFLPNSYFQMVGAVYCSHPIVFYIVGAAGLCKNDSFFWLKTSKLKYICFFYN
jgi:hypothetical protein